MVLLQHARTHDIQHDVHPTRHCIIYSRHPALLLEAGTSQAVPTSSPTADGAPAPTGGPPPEFQIAQFIPRERVLELAMGSLRSGSRDRKDEHRSGYTSVNEFVEWFVEDMAAAIEAEFPPAEVRC